MSDFVIAIPSLGRPDIVRDRTIAFLLRELVDPSIVTVYVVAEELQVYTDALADFIALGGNAPVVGVRGLPAQRNFVMSQYPEGQRIVFLDDDVESWDNTHSLQFNYSPLTDFFAEAFIVAQQEGCFIWSINPSNDPRNRAAAKEVTTNLKYCIGAFYGIINRRSDLHKFTANEKEDVKRTLHYFVEDGKVCVFSRIGFKTKYYGNIGGIGTHTDRIESSANEVANILRKYPNLGTSYVRDSGQYAGITEFRFKYRATRDDYLLGLLENDMGALEINTGGGAAAAIVVSQADAATPRAVESQVSEELSLEEILEIYESYPEPPPVPLSFEGDENLFFGECDREIFTRTHYLAVAPAIAADIRTNALARSPKKGNRVCVAFRPPPPSRNIITSESLGATGDFHQDILMLEGDYHDRVRALQKQLHDLSSAYFDTVSNLSRCYSGGHLLNVPRPVATRSVEGSIVISHPSAPPILVLPAVPAEEFANLYELLGRTRLGVQKERGRGFPEHECGLFGVAIPKVAQPRTPAEEFGKMVQLSGDSHTKPELFAEILRIGEIVCPPSFSFNTVTLNHNTLSPRHQDANNTGESVLVSFGEYSGSHICVEQGENNVVTINTRHQPVMFDGSTMFHWNSDDREGDKYSLVFYTRNNEFLRLR